MISLLLILFSDNLESSMVPGPQTLELKKKNSWGPLPSEILWALSRCHSTIDTPKENIPSSKQTTTFSGTLQTHHPKNLAKEWTFLEMFAGQANISRCCRMASFPGASMDIDYGGRAMDLTTDAGMGLLR